MRDDEPIGVDERELDDVALEALAEAHATRAPAALRARLLEAVASDAQTRRTRRALTRWRVVGALAASVAVAATGLLGREMQRTDTQAAMLGELASAKASLEQRLDEQGKTLIGLREALDTQAQILRVLGGPRTLSASLAPNEGFSGSGRVLVDGTSGEAAIVLTGVAAPEAGHVYELWAIRGGKTPEPAGLLRVAEGRPTAQPVAIIPAPDGVAAFAVSIEPAGGSKSPTGPIVLVGKVT
jgi:anti-sigma-K factor RskA